MVLRFILAVMIGFLLGGCFKQPAKPQTIKTQSIQLSIKTKQFRFNDLAILKQDRSKLELKLFQSGTLFKTIIIKNQMICINKHCLEKLKFIHKFIHPNYFEGMLAKLLRGEKLYIKAATESFINKAKGFEQKLYLKEKFDIIYKVQNQQLHFFFDKTNKILFRLKFLKN